MSKLKKLKKGQIIWFWYSASEIQTVAFERWCKTKMNTGGEDTDKIGVGALVKSDWLFKVNGGKRTQAVLRPYWDLYRTYKSAKKRRNEIKRPAVFDL